LNGSEAAFHVFTVLHFRASSSIQTRVPNYSETRSMELYESYCGRHCSNAVIFATSVLVANTV